MRVPAGQNDCVVPAAPLHPFRMVYMKAAVYLRQSVDKLGDELAIDRQRKDCLKTMRSAGLDAGRICGQRHQRQQPQAPACVPADAC